MRIAIVGSGISALVAAYHLQRHHDVTVFEQDAWVGGRAHTLTVADGDREIGVDTGFLVYNEDTCPTLTGLFASLGVATQATAMSVSVSCRRCRVAYSSHGPRGLFTEPALARRSDEMRLLSEMRRFHRDGRAALEQEFFYATSLADWVERQGYSDSFIRHFLMPLGAVIWSATPAELRRFPLYAFLRFFREHGLLAVDGYPMWRTVRGGSRAWVRALTRSFADRVYTQTPVAAIRRRVGRVEVTLQDGGSAGFDGVVIGTHADHALRLLADANDQERQALADIHYRPSEAILHTDHGWLPPRRDAAAACNVRLDDCGRDDAPVVMTYDLNRFQQLTAQRRYCLTRNAGARIAPERVLARIVSEHPVYTARTLVAQQHLRALSGARGTWFCGSYLGFGLDEDGARSGLEVARSIDAARAAA